MDSYKGANKLLKKSYIDEQERLLTEIKKICNSDEDYTLRAKYLIQKIGEALRWSVPAIKILLARCTKDQNFWYAACCVAKELPEKERLVEVEQILDKCISAGKYQHAKIIADTLPNPLRAKYLQKIKRTELLNEKHNLKNKITEEE